MDAVKQPYVITPLAGEWLAGYRLKRGATTIDLTADEAEYELRVGTILPPGSPIPEPQPDPLLLLTDVLPIERYGRSREATVADLQDFFLDVAPVIVGQTAAIAAAVAQVRGGTDAAHDTLAKLATLIEADRARINAILGGANPQVDTFIEAYNRFLTGETAAAAINTVLGTLQAAVAAHAGSRTNPHGVTKAQVGLGNVENLAPADLPVSTAQSAAIDALRVALLNGADAAHDTLGEIQARLLTAVSARLVAGDNLSDLTDTSAARTNLGLAIGADVQAFDADLAAIASLATTEFGRKLLTLADMASARSEFGLGDAATKTVASILTASAFAATGSTVQKVLPDHIAGKQDVSYAASPIAPGATVPATARADASRWATRKAVAGVDFGLPAGGDCAPAILDIMKSLNDRSGGRVQLPPIPIITGQPLDNRYSRVLVEGGGCGADYLHNAGTPKYGTTIVPAGAFTVLKHRTPYGGPSTPINSGGGFKDLRVIGNGTAPRLLEIDSISRGRYGLVLEQAVGTEAVLFKCGVEGTDFGESPCIQNIDCSIQVRQSDAGAAQNADCVSFTGSINANPSIIRNMHLDLVHKNGHAVRLGNSDNIYFDHRSYRLDGGTGYSLLALAAASEGGGSRANKWLRFSANAPSLFQGTDVAAFPANGHFLPGSIDVENGTPIPTCGPGALAIIDGLSIAFAPTVTSSGGPLGAYTAVGSFSYSGAMVSGLVRVVVSDKGSGSGVLLVAIPVRKRPGAIAGFVKGREYLKIGRGAEGIVDDDNLMKVRLIDDTFPASINGAVIILEFCYLV